MSNKDYFSKEYLPESSTEDSSKEIKVLKKLKDDFEIEQSKYGDSKPRRIIIKAKVIDG